MVKKKRGNPVKGEPKRRAALARWKKARRKQPKKPAIPTRPQREPTTIVFKKKAKFQGEYYRVYGKEGTRIRTIFPRPDLHPEFAKAPFGATFYVIWGGKKYKARKEARWQENNARVPCLVWEVKKSEA